MKNAIADKELIAEQLKKQMSPEDQAIVKKMSAAQKDELFAGNADYSAALSNEKAVIASFHRCAVECQTGSH